MQSKRHSLIESIANTAVGFILSMAAVQWVFPLFGVRMSIGENLTATSIMTVISVARGYALRRAFNRAGRR
jgi:hypothetical protein